MQFVSAIAAWSMVAFGALLFAFQLISNEIGFGLGRARAAKSTGQAESVGVVVGGMLALLAFVLALTLSFANGRYSELRSGTLAESNAIGTAWLRAKAIGTPRGEAIAKLLEEYTAVRREFVTVGPDAAPLVELGNRTSKLQAEIWGHVSSIVREQPSPISASVMASVNDVFDASSAEWFNFSFRLPPQIFWLLVGMSLLAMGCLGYQLGLRQRPLRVLMPLLALMWTFVIVDILDLASARIGRFQTIAIAYDAVLESFKTPIPITPPPSAP
jgi:hypothetical protein